MWSGHLNGFISVTFLITTTTDCWSKWSPYLCDSHTPRGAILGIRKPLSLPFHSHSSLSSSSPSYASCWPSLHLNRTTWRCFVYLCCCCTVNLPPTPSARTPLPSKFSLSLSGYMWKEEQQKARCSGAGACLEVFFRRRRTWPPPPPPLLLLPN